MTDILPVQQLDKSYLVADLVSYLVNAYTDASSVYYARGERADHCEVIVGDKRFEVKVREL